MNRHVTTMKLVFAVLLVMTARAWAANDTNPATATPATARDCYNAGTILLASKKFAEAEKMFQAALAAQDDRVQQHALYDVGDARFYDGLGLLKKGPDAQKTSERGGTALAAGDAAIHRAETALAQNNMNNMVDAYLQGHGARHELREAQKAVSAAMETYGKTLDLWLRAANDFKGASELNPADTNAVHNAKIVEQGIAKLIDSIQKMQQMMGMMGRQKQDLGQLLTKLKGQMPAQNALPGSGGDDDDEDDIKPESLMGKQEGPSREGEQMKVPLSPDQAGEILNGLSLDGTRRLDMGDKEGKPPGDRKGRNW